MSIKAVTAAEAVAANYGPPTRRAESDLRGSMQASSERPGDPGDAHTVIDVRSPAEFAEDHLPGALNWPVLDDEQRRIVGTLYVQDSPLAARDLSMGSYRLTLQKDGYAPMRWPFVVARNAEVAANVPLVPITAVPPGSNSAAGISIAVTTDEPSSSTVMISAAVSSNLRVLRMRPIGRCVVSAGSPLISGITATPVSKPLSPSASLGK